MFEGTKVVKMLFVSKKMKKIEKKLFKNAICIK